MPFGSSYCGHKTPDTQLQSWKSVSCPSDLFGEKKQRCAKKKDSSGFLVGLESGLRCPGSEPRIATPVSHCAAHRERPNGTLKSRASTERIVVTDYLLCTQITNSSARKVSSRDNKMHVVHAAVSNFFLELEFRVGFGSLRHCRKELVIYSLDFTSTCLVWEVRRSGAEAPGTSGSGLLNTNRFARCVEPNDPIDHLRPIRPPKKQKAEDSLTTVSSSAHHHARFSRFRSSQSSIVLWCCSCVLSCLVLP